MTKIGIIGGSGLDDPRLLKNGRETVVSTPFGEPSSPLTTGSIEGMDLVGIYVIAFITALGGGTLRDLLLDRHPLFRVANPAYALIIFVMAFAAAVVKKSRRLPQ